MAEDMGLALQNHQLEADNERLTRQLAEAREENARMRKLNEVLLKSFSLDIADPEYYNAEERRYSCFFCHESRREGMEGEVIPHTADCRWVRIRTLLAEKEVSDGPA